MGLSGDLNNQKWIKGIRFTKRKNDSKISKNARNSSLLEPENDTCIDKSSIVDNKRGVRKGNVSRLKFKKATTKGEQSVDVLRYGETNEEVETRLPPKKSSRTKRPNKLYHFGKDTNGYTFIAFTEDDVPTVNDSRLNIDEIDSDSEYETESESEQEGCSDSGYTYKQYVTDWGCIENGETCEFVPFPVRSNKVDNVNADNVKNFLKKKKIIKQERIRWHPDKMKSVLNKDGMWNDQISNDVTFVFQIINQVYESFNH